jgi:hypothetical protein
MIARAAQVAAVLIVLVPALALGAASPSPTVPPGQAGRPTTAPAGQAGRLTMAPAGQAGRLTTAPPFSSFTFQPLIGFADTGCILSERTFDLRFNLPDVFRDEAGRPYALSVTIVRLDGAFAEDRSVATTNFLGGKEHAVDGSDLIVSGERLQGRVRVALEPQMSGRGPRPADNRVHHLEVALDGRIVRQSPALWQVEGTFRVRRLLASGQSEAEAFSAPLAATLRPPVRPGGWNRGTADERGLRLALDLGTQRVNWNHCQAAVYEFAEPVDLRAYSGLRIRIERDPDEAERLWRVSAGVWLRESDGSWYYVKAAVPLCDPHNEAVVLFEDFAEAEWVAPTGAHMDEDYVLDLGAISHLGVGVVNPLGIGEVTFSVKGIDLVKGADAPRAAAPARLAVTGRMLSVNGHDRIPPGVFGGFAPDLPQEYRPGCQRTLGGPRGPRVPAKGSTEWFHIDCWYDRYNSAALLHSGNWQRSLTAAARSYARQARQAGYAAHLEFWNEPYLNWAKPPGRNYNPAYYETARAGAGEPVIGRATAMLFPHFAWRERGESWHMYDPTQFTYWSGRGNGFLYDRMLVAVAKAVKEAWPEVRVLAGWDFRWNEDHWAGWHMLYRPTLDRCSPYVDGVTEHHYQGDTTAMNGTYEVLVAHGKTRYNKWLYCYNTETNDLLDAPARGAVATPEKAARATQYRRMVYNLRDVVYCLLESPDKFHGRTVIHPVRDDGVQGWTHVAYGLMKNLRGRLVETASDDPQVWCVAGIDGTDPRAMPPEAGAPPTLVVLVFNDARRPRGVDLVVRSPAGTTFGGGVIERTTVDKETFAIGLRMGAAGVPPGATSAAFHVDLDERAAWKVSLPLAGALPARPEVERRQFFSKDLLATVTRQEPFRTSIRLDEAVLGRASRAWLRLVVEDIEPGEAAVTVRPWGSAAEGWGLFLPKAYTADNVTRILEVPVPAAALRPEMDLEFAVRTGNFLGYRVDLASIVLETLAEPALPPGAAIGVAAEGCP